MSDFKGRRFPTGIILVCVGCYCQYGISIRSNARHLERGTIADTRQSPPFAPRSTFVGDPRR
jgi:transposase-like protein